MTTNVKLVLKWFMVAGYPVQYWWWARKSMSSNFDIYTLSILNKRPFWIQIALFTIQVLGKAFAGDSFGEFGVLCYRPQPFKVRTTEISQILRLNRTSLMNTIQTNEEDGRIIMSNLFQVFALLVIFYFRKRFIFYFLLFLDFALLFQN